MTCEACEKMRFLPAEAGDIPDVLALYRERVRWMDEKGIRQWGEGYLEAYGEAYFRQRQSEGVLYVLRDAGEGAIAGAAVLLRSDARWADRAEDAAWYVHNLVTDPVVQGAGRRILAESEALARSSGARFMRLDCAVGSAFLNAYYQSMGYQVAGAFREGDFYEGIRREKALEKSGEDTK